MISINIFIWCNNGFWFIEMHLFLEILSLSITFSSLVVINIHDFAFWVINFKFSFNFLFSFNLAFQSVQFFILFSWMLYTNEIIVFIYQMFTILLYRNSGTVTNTENNRKSRTRHKSACRAREISTSRVELHYSITAAVMATTEIVQSGLHTGTCGHTPRRDSEIWNASAAAATTATAACSKLWCGAAQPISGVGQYRRGIIACLFIACC